MQVVYAYLQSSERSLNQSEKELFHSLSKSYDLYHYLMRLLLDVRDYAESRIDLARQKRIPTKEDLNPNMRFINNRLLYALDHNKALVKYLNNNKLSWGEHPELLKTLYNNILESEEYSKYMNRQESTFENDKQIIFDILTNQISNTELVHQILEEQSIYWNDDLEFVLSMVIRTLQKFNYQTSDETALLPQFNSDAEVDFAKNLFRKTILKQEANKELISKYTRNWDVDRIAFTDVVLLQLAITELLEFPTIPTRVTFNEYIEISKYYSTEKSSTFINGVLDKVLHELQDSNRIKKIGRGLIDESKPNEEDNGEPSIIIEIPEEAEEQTTTNKPQRMRTRKRINS